VSLVRTAEMVSILVRALAMPATTWTWGAAVIEVASHCAPAKAQMTSVAEVVGAEKLPNRVESVTFPEVRYRETSTPARADQPPRGERSRAVSPSPGGEGSVAGWCAHWGRHQELGGGP